MNTHIKTFKNILVYEAIQYTGKNFDECAEFVFDSLNDVQLVICEGRTYLADAGLEVNVGDWLIKSPSYHVDVFSDKVFIKSYKDADDKGNFLSDHHLKLQESIQVFLKLQKSLRAFFKKGSPQENHAYQPTTCGFCSLQEEDGHASDCVWLDLYEIANEAMGPMPIPTVDSDIKRYKFES